MLRTIVFVAAAAATLAAPIAASSAGRGGAGGAHAGGMAGAHVGGMAGAHVGGMAGARTGGVGSTGMSGGVHGFGTAAHFGRSGNFAGPNVRAVPGFSGSRNVSSFHTGAVQRNAFFNRRFHHGRHFFFGAPIFAGAAIGYDYDSCWRWTEVPTPYGVTTQRVWVCGDYGDYYGGDYGY